MEILLDPATLSHPAFVAPVSLCALQPFEERTSPLRRGWSGACSTSPIRFRGGRGCGLAGTLRHDAGGDTSLHPNLKGCKGLKHKPSLDTSAGACVFLLLPSQDSGFLVVLLVRLVTDFCGASGLNQKSSGSNETHWEFNLDTITAINWIQLAKLLRLVSMPYERICCVLPKVMFLDSFNPHPKAGGVRHMWFAMGSGFLQ